MKINNRGQVGTGISWFVATIVILAIVAVSIITATLLGVLKTKDVSFTKKYDDLIATKSLYAFLNTAEVGGKSYEQLNTDGKFNERDSKIAESIFESYKENYPQIWLGIISYKWQWTKDELFDEFPKLKKVIGTRLAPEQNIDIKISHIMRTITLPGEKYQIRFILIQDDK